MSVKFRTFDSAVSVGLGSTHCFRGHGVGSTGHGVAGQGVGSGPTLERAPRRIR